MNRKRKSKLKAKSGKQVIASIIVCWYCLFTIPFASACDLCDLWDRFIVILMGPTGANGPESAGGGVEIPPDKP